MMRYSVRYDAVANQWLVLDTGIAIQVVGIYSSEVEAIEFAKKREERYMKYGRVQDELVQTAA